MTIPQLIPHKVEERSSKLVVTKYFGRIHAFKSIQYVTARRLADFLPVHDVNGTVFCAVMAVLLFFKPWQYLLTGPRHGLLLLLGLGAVTPWLLVHDGLDTKVQRFCRVLCVYAVFLNLARYPVAVIGNTANGLVAGPIYLVVVQGLWESSQASLHGRPFCNDWRTGKRTIQPLFSEYIDVRK
jgi:hypothetical protein